MCDADLMAQMTPRAREDAYEQMTPQPKPYFMKMERKNGVDRVWVNGRLVSEGPS